MDFNKSQPIYIQLMDDIKLNIIRGNIKSGEQLPSIREYAEKNMVNPNTAQKAFAELEALGYIFSKRGVGFFVNESDDFIKTQKDSYLNSKIDEFIGSMTELDYSKEFIINKIKTSYQMSNKK